MIIVSDSLKDNLDEGCIKVASTTAKKLKKEQAFVVAVNCECNYADKSVRANKMYTDPDLYKAIEAGSGSILYIPFASNTLGSAIRTFFLSRKSKRQVNVLFALRWLMNLITKLFLKLSRCRIITLSQDSYDFYKREIPEISSFYVKTGVDTSKFCPVDIEKKESLKKKYGMPLDKTIVLHVGHLSHGRNIDVFLGLDDSVYSVLVFSSVTEQDSELKESLKARKNIRIVDEYVPNIEELYQAADIYVFPVVAENNSIDVPLSVLEAAGCNCRIVCTCYKEIAFFEETAGLIKAKNEEINDLMLLIQRAKEFTEVSTRRIAEEYDWSKGISELKAFIE